MVLGRFFARANPVVVWLGGLLVLGLLLALTPADAVAEGEKPNILFILADDYGVDKMELYFDPAGDDTIPPTPRLAELAEHGIVYENMWSAPNCSPTRAHVHTGQYGFRTGIRNVTIAPGTSVEQLDLTNPYLLGKLLQAQGYFTGFIGKWQLNWPDVGEPSWPSMPNYIPDAGYSAVRAGAYGSYAPDRAYTDAPAHDPQFPCDETNSGPPLMRRCNDDGTPFQGIEYFYPTTHIRRFMSCGPGTLFVPCLFTEGLPLPPPPPQDPDLHFHPDRYSTTYETTAAFELMDLAASEGKPWFINLSYHTPHPPYVLPPVEEVDQSIVDKIIELDPDGYVKGRRYTSSPAPYWDDRLAMLAYAAMVSAMDNQIGRLLDDPRVSLEDTYVLFTGDNGTPSTVVVEGLELVSKSAYYQLGMNVPFIVAGPDIKEPGRRSKALVSTVDVYSTVLEMAGVPTNIFGRPRFSVVPASHPIDGRSIMKTFSRTGKNYSVRATVYNEIEFLTGNPGFPDAIPGTGSAYGGFDGETIRNKRYKLIAATAFFEDPSNPVDPLPRYPDINLGFPAYYDEDSAMWKNGSWACVDGPVPTEVDPIGCQPWDRVKALEFYDLKKDPLEQNNLLDKPRLNLRERLNLASLKLAMRLLHATHRE
jgi:arylsulfatase A-like enzyme